MKRDNIGKLASINVLGLPNQIKRGVVIEAFEALRFDVLCLQVHVRGEGKPDTFDERNSVFAYVGYKSKSDTGVGVLFSSRVQIEDVKLVSARLARADIVFGGLKMRTFTCYAPPDTDSHLEEYKDTMFVDIPKQMRAIKAPYKPVIMGDFNASIDKEAHGSGWQCLGEAVDDHVSETHGDNGHRLLTFCGEFGLFLKDTMKFQKAQGMWRIAMSFTKRIDYNACGRFLWDRSLSCRVRRGSSQFFTSDHYLLE